MALGPIVVDDAEHAAARDPVTEVPEGVEVIARNAAGVQAIHVPARGWWGTQFHPELSDESHPAGERVLANAARLITEEPTAS